MECLEHRVLLAGDLSTWHNPVLPEDVNADSVVALDDVLLIANELHRTGARSLLAEAQREGASLLGTPSLAPSAAGAEGEAPPPLFLDVNGDNYLSPADALMVARRLIAEGQVDVAQMRFDITNTTGTSINSVDVGDSFKLNVFVQDIRANTVPDRGVFSAFLDIFYDAPLVSISGPITFGPKYSLLQDQSNKSTPGEIQDAGNAQTDVGLGGPVGPGEFLLLTVPFTVDAAPLRATNDNAGTDATLNVAEDSPGVLIDVLANDTLNGPTELRGAPAESPPKTDVLFFNDPSNPVPPEDIIYGSDVLAIISTGSLLITAVGPTSQGGTALSASGGTRVQYSPPAASNALGTGETATDSYSYTVSAGFASATATVTVTLVGQNDVPTAQDASFGTNEESLLSDSLAPYASDPDSNDSLTFSGATSSALGAAVAVNPDGTFTYDPSISATLNALPAGGSVADTFSYTVDDGNGGSDTATVTVTVTGLNDPPLATADSGPGFATDEDTAFVTANVLANDTDVDGDTLSIIGLDTTGTLGVVTDNGDGTFGYDPRGRFDSLAAGQSTTDVFAYTVSDGHGGSDTATVTITVHGLNDPPKANDDFGPGFTTDQDTPLVTGNVLANDTDAEGDLLSLVGINTTGTWGEVTNRGDGTFGYDPNGQFDLLGSGQNATDFFRYTISDGNGGTDTATVAITVTGLNDPPTAGSGSFGTDEDTPINDTLANLADDPDADDVLLFSGGSTSTLGAAVTIHPDGTFSYDPTGSGTLQAMLPGETLADTFSYTVSDGVASDSAQVTITVSGRNDPPVARHDDLFVDEQSSDNVLDVLHNDSDPDANDTLTVISVGPTDQGGTASVAADGLSVVYTPNAGFIGNETFSYTIQDGSGATATATVAVDVEAVTLPRARRDSFTVVEDSHDNNLDVFGNDRINEGGTPSISLSGDPDHGGSVVITGPTTLQYTPVADFFGTETFRYTLGDGIGTPQEAVVTVTVTGINDAPQAADDAFSTDEDTTFVTANVLANDTDVDGDTLSIISLDTTGTLGEVTNNGNGTFGYDPNGQFDSLAAGQSTTDTFTYTVGDGHGGSDTAMVTITVNGLNDSPVARDDSGSAFKTDQDAAFVTGNVLANDTDAEGDSLSIVGIDTTGTLGVVTDHGDGTYGYDPHGQFDFLGPGQTATDSFTYTVTDGNGGTDTATVAITVVGLNDLPVAVDDSGAGFTTDEDTAFVTASVLANDTDVDHGTLAVASIDTTGTLGQVTGNGDGTFRYDPGAQFQALGTGAGVTDSFVYTLSDGQGGSDTATVTITINGVNDAPVASDDAGVGFTTDQDSAFTTANVLANDHDAENDPLSIVSIDTTGTLGQVTDNGDGTFAYDPGGEFDFLGVGQTAGDTFTYTVGDGNGGTDTATVTVTVTGLNDSPTAQDASFGTTEDAPLGGSLASRASDPDGNDLLIFSAGNTSARGAAVTLKANGSFTYDPTVSGALQALLPGQSLADTFTYTVTDGGGKTAVATVTINVSGVNDAPTAQSDSFSGILEDSSNNVLNVLANDSTAPESGETLTITSVGPTSAGGTVVNEASRLKYTPAPNFFGTETWSYTIADGHGGSGTATVSVAVTPQNDPPTANDDSFGFVSNTGPHVLGVLANDTFAPDVGESLTIVSTSTPNRGGTVVNQGGQLLYTPPTGMQGQVTETFTYTIDDGTGLTDTATVTINLTGFLPSSLLGNAFIDTDRDSLRDSGERGIGDVNVTLTGVDMFGHGVSLATTTSGDGSYWFSDLVPGSYTISSPQEAFLLDGPERIGTQGGNDSVNDQLSVSIPAQGGVVGRENNFAESGLQPQYYSIWDFLNTSSRKGVLFATDSRSGQMWFSFLDGWDNFKSATARISADGATLNLTFVDQALNVSTRSVPFRESAVLHIRGSVGTQYLVQLVGAASNFGLAGAPAPANGMRALGAEGEGVSSLPAYAATLSPVSSPESGGPAPAGGLEAHASGRVTPSALPAAIAAPANPPSPSSREWTFAALAAEGEFLGTGSRAAGGDRGVGNEGLSSPRDELAPDAAPLLGGSGADARGATYADPGADSNTLSDTAEDRRLAVDAVFGDADDGDSWESLLDESFGQQYEESLGAMPHRLFSPWDGVPV